MEVSSRNLLGGQIPGRDRWRRFGARKVLGSVKVVKSPVANRRERCSSIGKFPSINATASFKMEGRRVSSIW